VGVVLPNFLIIGAMKAGTTSLYAYVRAHPQVFMPETKELDYFIDSLNWNKGQAWYERQFAGAGDAVAVGEASPHYASGQWAEVASGHIADVLPDARLVYVLRDPLARMVSHHRHGVSEWGWQGSLDDLLLDPARRVELIGTSKYAKQIDRYLEQFDREQLCVITSEDLNQRRVETLRGVYEHLGVDPDFVPGEVEAEANRGADHRQQGSAVRSLRDKPAYRAIRNAVPSGVRNLAWRAVTRPPVDAEPSRLSPEMRAAVLAELRPDLERLRTHLGTDFHCWGLLDGDPRDSEG
jgi:hypothetical protein